MESFDIVIVGGGAAGLAAAIDAGENASVLVVEQLPYLGGSAKVSGGGCLAVGTKIQAQMGLTDSVELAVRDWVTATSTEDEPWARYYLSRSLNEVHLWAEKLGVLWERLRPSEEGNSVSRRHYPRNGGLALMQALAERAGEMRNIQTMTSTTCDSLLSRDDGVTGIKIERAAARPAFGQEEIRAGGVILTTGGFCSNREMIAEFAPYMKRFRFMEGSGEGSKGKGHLMLRALGAAFSPHLGEMTVYVYATPDHRDATGRRGLVVRRIHGNIWVNSRGERFHNEVDYDEAGTRAFVAQDPPTVWSVLEESMALEAEVVDPYYREGDRIFTERVKELFDNSPFIAKDATLQGLAVKIGVDPARLSRTVETYDAYFREGLDKDPLFHKPLAGLKPIETPPFYAVRFFPLARKSLAGVVTDLKGRVLDEENRPIDGVYAAGELASPLGCRIGYSGHVLGQCLLSGRMAGAGAAADRPA